MPILRNEFWKIFETFFTMMYVTYGMLLWCIYGKNEELKTQAKDLNLTLVTFPLRTVSSDSLEIKSDESAFENL